MACRKKGAFSMKCYSLNCLFSRFLAVGAIMALLLVGCGSGEHPPTANQPTAVTNLTASAVLKHMPQGSALLTWTPGNQTLNVNVHLYGLAPSSTHPTRLQSGSCSKQGPIVYTLNNVVADAHGVASVTTQIKNVKNGIPASGWYVNVHNGPGLSPADQFLPIVCGDISNPAPTTTSLEQITTPLISAQGSGDSESAHGSAHLQLAHNILTVTLVLSGLQPDSTHAAHIHAGSCQSQGAVVYPLDVVKADSSGNASETTTIPNVKTIAASGWYINVHQSTNLSAQTGFDPIACGDVQLTS